MSILIKGMEMPKNCHNCELLTRVEVTYGAVYACQILNEVIGNVMVRQIRCPLIPVPPHGRLIDADAPIPLVDTHGKKIEVTVAHIIENNLGIVNAIIEAEEGEW